MNTLRHSHHSNLLNLSTTHRLGQNLEAGGLPEGMCVVEQKHGRRRVHLRVFPACNTTEPPPSLGKLYYRRSAGLSPMTARHIMKGGHCDAIHLCACARRASADAYNTQETCEETVRQRQGTHRRTCPFYYITEIPDG